MSRDPKHPTESLSTVLARIKARLDGQAPMLPRPTTDEPPAKPWQDDDPDPTATP